MEDLAAVRRVKLEQCVGLATYQSDASQVPTLPLPLIPTHILHQSEILFFLTSYKLCASNTNCSFTNPNRAHQR